MATTTNTTQTQPNFDAAFEQVKDLNEQFVGAARKAGVQYLDTYEKAVDRAIDAELKLAGAAKQEWLKGVIDTHVDLTRQMTDAYTKAARGLLK
jgi:hypothetical protein